MKRLLVLLLGLAIQSQASTMLWTGMDPDAVVHVGDQEMTLVQFFEDRLEDAMFRITADGSYLDFVWDAYTTSPGVDGASILVWDANDEPTGEYAKFAQVELPDSLNIVTMELGIFEGWVPTDPDRGYFKLVAVSAPVTLNELSGHTYPRFDLNPPSAGDWTPHDFYAPTPEPSIAHLMTLGVVVLLLRRKHEI